MSETFREQVERVIQMSDDSGETWDLSPNDQAALKAVLQRMAVLDEQVQTLEAEIADAREACPVVRRQDYFDAPLLTLIEAEISQLFSWQSQAEAAVKRTQELERERDRLLKMAGEEHAADIVELVRQVQEQRERADAAERELAAERDISLNDSTEQRAERYAHEAADLTRRLEASERQVEALRSALTGLHMHVTDAVAAALTKPEPTP